MRNAIFLLILLSLVTLFVATGIGPVSVAPGTTARILLSRLPGVGNGMVQDWEPVEESIVFALRMPRVCLGMVVGAALRNLGAAQLITDTMTVYGSMFPFTSLKVSTCGWMMMASDADMILRISCLYLKQRQNADDICQDVFLKLMLLDSDVVVGKPPIDL